MPKKRSNGCAIVLALVCVFIVSMTVYGNKFAHGSPPKDRVTVRGFTGNGVVQMFDALTPDARVIAEVANGESCAKVSGPVDGSEAGISMYFYLLDCDGTRGYVNTKWVAN